MVWDSATGKIYLFKMCTFDIVFQKTVQPLTGLLQPCWHLLRNVKRSQGRTYSGGVFQSRLENPQKLAQLSPSFHPRHLFGKRTAQKDTILDITFNSFLIKHTVYRSYKTPGIVSDTKSFLTIIRRFVLSIYSILSMLVSRQSLNCKSV